MCFGFVYCNISMLYNDISGIVNALNNPIKGNNKLVEIGMSGYCRLVGIDVRCSDEF